MKLTAAVAAAGLAALSQPCVAEDFYILTSASEMKSYGLLLTAPDPGCRRVRYSVQGDDGLLGRTPALGPGELAVVRMGRGFAPGEHRLVIVAAGCDRAPAEARRVTLAKDAPDHGWRWETAARAR